MEADDNNSNSLNYLINNDDSRDSANNYYLRNDTLSFRNVTPNLIPTSSVMTSYPSFREFSQYKSTAGDKMHINYDTRMHPSDNPGDAGITTFPRGGKESTLDFTNSPKASVMTKCFSPKNGPLHAILPPTLELNTLLSTDPFIYPFMIHPNYHNYIISPFLLPRPNHNSIPLLTNEFQEYYGQDIPSTNEAEVDDDKTPNTAGSVSSSLPVTFSAKYLIANLIETKSPASDVNLIPDEGHRYEDMSQAVPSIPDNQVYIVNRDSYVQQNYDTRGSTTGDDRNMTPLYGDRYDYGDDAAEVNRMRNDATGSIILQTPSDAFQFPISPRIKSQINIENLVHTITPGTIGFRTGISKILQAYSDNDETDLAPFGKSYLELPDEVDINFKSNGDEVSGSQAENSGPYEFKPLNKSPHHWEKDRNCMNYMKPPLSMMDQNLAYFWGSTLPYNKQYYDYYTMSEYVKKSMEYSAQRVRPSPFNILRRSLEVAPAHIKGKRSLVSVVKSKYKKCLARRPITAPDEALASDAVKSMSLEPPDTPSTKKLAVLPGTTPKFLVNDANGNIHPNFGDLNDMAMDRGDDTKGSRIGRGRRQRTIFSGDQTSKLEREFKKCEYVSREQRQGLARALYLSESQVKIWFQNRRAKDKRIEKASASTCHIGIGQELEDPRMQGCCLIRACPPFGLKSYTQKYAP